MSDQKGERPRKSKGTIQALLDVQVPFFRPLWRRIATVVVVAGWTIMEIVNGNPAWAVLAGGIGAYLIWQFFVVFDPPQDNGTNGR